MKYIIALVAACASAQEMTEEEYNAACANGELLGCNENTWSPTADVAEETSTIGSLITLNDEGRWQLNLPQLPEISFADVDQATLEEWATDKEAAYAALDQKWVEAWGVYQDAIAQPWSNFLDETSDYVEEGQELEMETFDEMITFVAENTFINGMSLADTFPGIEGFLGAMDDSADNLEDRFNLDSLNVTPRVLQESMPQCYWDESNELVCHDMEEMMQDAAANTRNGEIISAIQDKIISYGFDSEVVEAWFESQSESMAQLQQEHQIAEAQQIQATVAEASDYMQQILDNAVADLRGMAEESNEQALSFLDQFVADWKAQVDSATQEQIDDMQGWIDETNANIQNIAETPVEDEYVSLASVVEPTVHAKKQSSNKALYGYGAATLGAAAGLAYFLKKRQNAKLSEQNESLLSNDEDYVQV